MQPASAVHPTGTVEDAVEAAAFAATVPAFARAWAGCEVSAAAWTRLPFLTKQDLIDDVVPGRPYGDRLGVPESDVAWVFVAPGPIYMPYSAADIDEIADRFASAFASCGITPDDVVDQTTLYNWVIAATALGRGLERLGCTVVPGGSGDTLGHIENIERLGVTGILAFPTFLTHLLDTASEQGRKLPLKHAVVMGELHDPQEKERILEQHGVSVREYYGTADVGPVAAECIAANGMHLRHGVYVEFIDPETGAPSRPEPGRPAEIVVTDLVRRAIPIIRLRTGDLVDELIEEPCGCGNPAPRIRRIVGRVGDITKIKGMFVVPALVGRVLERNRAARRFQLVVSRESGRDELRILFEGTEPDGWAHLHQEIEHVIRVRFTCEFVPAIEGDRLLKDTRVLV